VFDLEILKCFTQYEIAIRLETQMSKESKQYDV